MKQDVHVLNRLMLSLPEKSVRRARLSLILNKAIDAYDRLITRSEEHTSELQSH